MVDALLKGCFSKVPVVQHMYETLQALIHNAQVCKLFGGCVFLMFFWFTSGQQHQILQRLVMQLRLSPCYCFLALAGLSPCI